MYFSALCLSYHWNHPTGADTAAEAHPPLVVRILSPPHEILVAHEVRALIDHKAATLYPDGVAAAEVQVKVCAVITALIGATLEVLVLVEDDLDPTDEAEFSKHFKIIAFVLGQKDKNFDLFSLIHVPCRASWLID